MSHTIQVQGLIRFSVLTEDYYADKFDSIDKIAAHIFAPERMERRFHLFEKLCLPSLMRQTDMDFRLGVITSTHLPGDQLERLLSITAPHDNVVLFPEEPAKQYKLLRRSYARLRDERFSHSLSFRIDDDDAVDTDFIARIKRQASGLLQVADPASRTMIAHNYGFYIDMNTDGPNRVFDAKERMPLSVGSALLSPMADPGLPYAYNHRKFAQHYNVYSDIDTPAFLRTLHPDNKSDPAQLGLIDKMKPGRVDRLIRDHFGVEVSDLQAL
ncbi:glycosyltransferase [Pseudaestuariivita sp.]|uniref:glycosyltransferase n=1 Tax=Pseudaestuariivita sp. TaxID=2211669 RepID=UPI00405A385E